jgi:RhtB (resistance to homoserine/threonine) family protein
MEYLPLIISVFLINLVAAISPGPDFVMCVRNSLMYSRRTGIFTGIGIGLGLAIHISYCAAGLGFIVTTSEVIFNLIKYTGAAYLIYMGLNSYLNKKDRIIFENVQQQKDISKREAVKIGFLTNVLNPKASVFFIGLFALVIGKNTPVSVIVIISTLMILTAITWFGFVATIFSQRSIRTFFIRYEKKIGWFFGAVLIILGIKIALTAL